VSREPRAAGQPARQHLDGGRALPFAAARAPFAGSVRDRAVSVEAQQLREPSAPGVCDLPPLPIVPARLGRALDLRARAADAAADAMSRSE